MLENTELKHHHSSPDLLQKNEMWPRSGTKLAAVCPQATNSTVSDENTINTYFGLGSSNDYIPLFSSPELSQ